MKKLTKAAIAPKPEPKGDPSTIEHNLSTIASDGITARWVCSCGMQGIPVRSINTAAGEVICTAEDRAKNAFDLHVALMKNPERDA